MSSEGNAVAVPEGDGADHPLRKEGPKTFETQPVAQTSTGLQLPKLGLGTWQLEDRVVADIVPEALLTGYRHIDTAQMYGNERSVGRAIAEADIDRDEVFLTTKIGNENHEPADLVRSVETSLDDLGTGYVDLLLIHWPVRWDIIGATLAALTQVQASGLANHIGVSNFTVEQLEMVIDLAPIQVVQVECHPFLQQRHLRRWCREHDLLVTASSPLAQGETIDDPVLSRIGADHDTTGAGVALAWLTHQPEVSVIPRTTDVEHLVANWTSGFVRLTPEERNRIDGLDRGHRVIDPDHAPWHQPAPTGPPST